MLKNTSCKKSHGRDDDLRRQRKVIYELKISARIIQSRACTRVYDRLLFGVVEMREIDVCANGVIHILSIGRLAVFSNCNVTYIAIVESFFKKGVYKK